MSTQPDLKKAPTNKDLLEVKELLVQNNPGGLLNLSLKQNEHSGATLVHLDFIGTVSRRQGIGEKLLSELCDVADSKGWVLTLETDSRHGTPTVSLTQWCQKHGFLTRSVDLKTHVSSMLRWPKQ